MIDENRMKHMLGVARKCYQLALEDGKSEEIARTYFVMGLLHDIGYEFTEDGKDHAEIGYEVLHNLGTKNAGIFRWGLVQRAIKEHGNPKSKLYASDNDKVRILNEADMLISYDGKEVSIDERLSDIKQRYGEKSKEYKKAEQMSRIIEYKKSNRE